MELIYWVAACSSLIGISVAFAYYFHGNAASVKDEYEALRQQFHEVDIEDEKVKSAQQNYASLQQRYSASKAELDEKRSIINQHDLGVGTVDDTLCQITHKTDDIEKLELKLGIVKATIKDMVRNKEACICKMGDGVAVNGRKAGAKKLFNREIKLRIRCLDNEVKAAIALADWNNIGRLNDRVKCAYYDINKRGDMAKTYLMPDYLEAKLRELNLTFEIAQLKALKKEEDREQRRFEREAEKEEQKIKAAAEKAKKDRERMEKLVQRELAKLETMTDEQRIELEAHQKELEVLKSREQRAVSMAQQTRAGFVYVISNVNSFGKEMVKVGMTRRVDPNQRVRELGDASVPDIFDVHGFFYCEDAPRLESEIHKQLENERVNLVNKRKEFFFVDADKVIQAIEEHELETTLVEAC